MKLAALLLCSLVLPLASIHAAGEMLEIRLIKLTGTKPSDKTLRALVEDPGAQACAKFAVLLARTGETEIKQLAPYRYPTEFNGKGEPDAFETRKLGWEGTASVVSADREKITLNLNISNLRMGTPHVYETNGVQTYMPVFSSFRLSTSDLQLPPGEWKFVKTGAENDPFFLAVRVADIFG